MRRGRAAPGLAVAERPYWRGGGERDHEPPEHNARHWSAQLFCVDVTGAQTVTLSAPGSRVSLSLALATHFCGFCFRLSCLRLSRGFCAIEVRLTILPGSSHAY